MSTPTTQLPLFYAGAHVGHALVDRDLGERLSPKWLWGLEIPRALRALHPERPDIIAARLTSEPDTLARCHPFLQYRGLVIRLSHLALRPTLVDPLLSLSGSPYDRALKLQLRAGLSSVLRVSFVNRSRVDCRVSNLREVSVSVDDAEPHTLDATHPSTIEVTFLDLKEFLK